jgi:hypothetical protein
MFIKGTLILKTGTGVPGSLNTGEPAWDNTSNTLYIGNTSGVPIPFASNSIGGGSGSPHALLDNSQNIDTKAVVVTRGYIIVGNSTPLWDALAPGAANSVVGYNGTDVCYFNTVGTGNVARTSYIDNLTTLSGIGAPPAGLGSPNTVYFDVTDPYRLQFYYKT